MSVTTRPALVNGLSVDVEDWFHGFEAVPFASWHRYEHRLAASLDRVLGLFARHGVFGTFFVLGYVAEHYPHLVRRVAAAGHEIGTHGYAHRLVYTQSREAFRADLCRSIDALGDACGLPIAGHRAARFSILPRSAWALDALLACGLRYDSSIFPIRHYRYGWPDAPRRPCRLRLAGGTLVELPLPTLGIGRIRLPVGGGAYQRILPLAVSSACLRAINAAGLPFVLYLHPWELDPCQPRLAVAPHVALTHYWRLDRTERRFDALLRRFRFGPLATLAARSDLPEVSLR